MGQSRHFAASSDNVEVADNVDLRVSNHYTLAFWLKPSVYGNVLSKKGAGFLWGHSTYNLMYLVNEAGSYTTCPITTPMLTGWHHIVVTTDDLATKFYVDGILIQTGSILTGLFSNTSVLRVGQATSAVAGVINSVIGYIAHIQLFSRAITLAEVQALFQSPASVTTGLLIWLKMTDGSTTTEHDASGNGNIGAVTGAAPSSDGPDIIFINHDELLNIPCLELSNILQVNNSGSRVVATVNMETGPMDISGNFDSMHFSILKPDKTSVNELATYVTDGTDGKLQFITGPNGVPFDQVGEYSIQAHIEDASGVNLYRSSIVKIEVKANLA